MPKPHRSGTVAATLYRLAQKPYETLVLRWNWKSALLSSIFRGGIFFAVNLRAGLEAASGAMLAEFAFRLATAGFYGALTQSFRCVQPAWQAALAVMLLLPLVQHSLEFTVHLLRGTPLLLESIGASAIFTAISTLCNLHLMRNGAMIVGDGQRSLLADLAATPKLLLLPLLRCTQSPK